MQQILQSVDALILIHPDFAPPELIYQNPNYLQSLKKATNYLIELNKPIFFQPATKSEIYYPEIAKLTKQWQRINSFFSYIYNQTAVEQISRVIGKDPEEIHIAAGGIAAGACVSEAMKTWCQEVYAHFTITKKPQQELKRKFRRGDIISELTEKLI
ncbi:MAG: hypothetical protein KKH52_04360 [Nanoarchaeota archaeon]|nr:hypothetical protein [Nanoarchaeota archaeon]MBU1621967.1 hypothetical protein [Nanoarchaeota archaeon]MBU1974601.1 hypothetical protein [Nanoarchaeota archaeon]